MNAILRLLLIPLILSAAAAETCPAQDIGAKNLWVYRQSVALGIPEQELSKLVADCQSRGFAVVEIQNILGLIAKAKVAGLPHGDLLSKLREGIVKKASPEVIDAALAEKAGSLAAAKEVVDALAKDGFEADAYNAAIQLVSNVLDAGLSPETVKAMVMTGTRPPEGLPDPAMAFRKVSSRKK